MCPHFTNCDSLFQTFFTAVMKDPESVQKEIPEIQQSMKDFGKL